MPSRVPVVRGIAALGLCVGVALVCVRPAPAQPTPPAPPTIDDIVRVWEERQAKVKSLRAELAIKEMIYKGYVNVMQDPLGGKKGEPPNPPRDYEVEGVAIWVTVGDKLRYTRDKPVWGPNTRTLHQEHYVTVFDGKLFSSLQIPASSETSYPFAIIKPAPRSQAAMMIALMPLVLTFRGHHDQFFKDLRLYEVTGRAAPIRGRSCLELVYQSRSLNRRELMYLDPGRGYVVTRTQTIVGDTPTWQLDVSYDPDPLAGWVPREWEYMIRRGSPPVPYQSGKWRATRYELNGPVADGEFELTYPPGTRVADASAGKEVQYVVSEKGEFGPKVPTSQNPKYDDLRRAAESPPRWWERWRMVVLPVGAALVVMTMAVWARRRRRPDAPAPTDVT